MSAARTLAWIDASQGAAGDMLLGALVDLGVPLEALRDAVRSLPVDGWRIDARRISRRGLCATKVDVTVDEKAPARGWADLERIVSGGSLSPSVERRALSIFRKLIEAEAEVHGGSPETVHLHEAGAIDAIVDVVGTCVGLEQLGIDEIVVSEMTTGFGEVRCAHGVYPVPAPATALLVRGAPVRGGAIAEERLTPTGAAILTTLADRWGSLPAMRPGAIGQGAGSRDLGESPNLLRIITGRAEPCERDLDGARGEVAVIECTVDDATPQSLAFAARGLLAAGALDAYTVPATMKKGRQGHQLTVLARPGDLPRLARQVLRETSTLGLRFRLERRFELERSLRRVQTEYGAVAVKIGMLDGEVLHAWPEYDDCATLAERHGLPLARIQQAALAAYDSRDDGD